MGDFADQTNFGPNWINAQTISLAIIQVIDTYVVHLLEKKSNGYIAGILPPRSEAYDIGGARGEYIKYILPFNRYVGYCLRCHEVIQPCPEDEYI